MVKGLLVKRLQKTNGRRCGTKMFHISAVLLNCNIIFRLPVYPKCPVCTIPDCKECTGCKKDWIGTERSRLLLSSWHVLTQVSFPLGQLLNHNSRSQHELMLTLFWIWQYLAAQQLWETYHFFLTSEEDWRESRSKTLPKQFASYQALSIMKIKCTKVTCCCPKIVVRKHVNLSLPFK